MTRARHPFVGATLFLSARSPFARRVRVALLEAGIPVQEQLEDVLRPTPALLEANPLGRVPTLRLASGEVLLESQVILERLWEACAPDPAPLRPRDPVARLRADAASGLAIGVCELAVLWFFEGLRPEGHRDRELLEEIRRGVDGALARLEAMLGAGPFLLGAEPSSGDVDVAIALDYVSLRVERAWEARHPGLRALAGRMAERESVRRTAPPPA